LLECLISSLAQLPGKLWSCKVMARKWVLKVNPPGNKGVRILHTHNVNCNFL